MKIKKLFQSTAPPSQKLHMSLQQADQTRLAAFHFSAFSFHSFNGITWKGFLCPWTLISHNAAALVDVRCVLRHGTSFLVLFRNFYHSSDQSSMLALRKPKLNKDSMHSRWPHPANRKVFRVGYDFALKSSNQVVNAKLIERWDCALLRCYAAQNGSSLPTFRNNLTVVRKDGRITTRKLATSSQYPMEVQATLLML